MPSYKDLVDDEGGNESEAAQAIMWTIAEAVVSDSAGSMVVLMNSLYDLVNEAKSEDEDILRNPQFIANGHTTGKSPKTQKYFKYRKKVSMFSTASSIASELASGATQVSVGDIAMDSNAVGSTAGHIAKLCAIGKRYKKSDTITGWVKAIQRAKTAKLSLRSASLASAFIPIAGLSLGASVVNALAAAGVKISLGGLMARVAMELHWRAYQEVTISSVFSKASGPVGPASAILYELFTKRGMSRIWGKHDVGAIIREPGGWMAVHDKLMLI